MRFRHVVMPLALGASLAAGLWWSWPWEVAEEWLNVERQPQEVPSPVLPAESPMASVALPPSPATGGRVRFPSAPTPAKTAPSPRHASRTVRSGNVVAVRDRPNHLLVTGLPGNREKVDEPSIRPAAVPTPRPEPDRATPVAMWRPEDWPGLPAVEGVVVDLTNAERRQAGLPPLVVSAALELAARQHSQEMNELGYYSHASPIAEHRRPTDRGRLAGFAGGVGENIFKIAIRRRTWDELARQLVAGWMNSSGHRQNILNPHYRSIGVGCHQSGSWVMATQNFSSAPP